MRPLTDLPLALAPASPALSGRACRPRVDWRPWRPHFNRMIHERSAPRSSRSSLGDSEVALLWKARIG